MLLQITGFSFYNDQIICKGNNQKNERQPTEWRKISANDITHKGLIFKIYCCWFTKLCPTFCNSMDCSLSGSTSMEFSSQEYRSGLPFPTPEDRPDTGIEPYLLCLCLARGFCTTAPNNSYNSTGEKKETKTQITQLKNGQWPGTDILPKKIYKWPASIEKVCNITSDQGNAN